MTKVDVITPDKVTAKPSEAIRQCCSINDAPELIGRLVDVLVENGLLSPDDLRGILLPGYEVKDV